MQAVIDGKKVLAGNAKLMEREHIRYQSSGAVGTVIYLACDGTYSGSIVIEDEIKQDAPSAIRQLKSSGIRKTVMLTGDADAVGQKVSGRLGLDQAYTELLPADKVDRVEALLRKKQKKANLSLSGTESMMPPYWQGQMSVSLWVVLALMPLSKPPMWS